MLDQSCIFYLLFFTWFSFKKFKLSGFPGLFAGFWISLGFTAYVFAMYNTTVANVNFTITTQTIFLALLLFSGTEIGAGMNWSLVGDFFGRENFATIRGSMAPIYNISLFTMPIAAGWVKDTTDSYEIVLIAGAIMLLLSGLVFGILKKPSRN